jgi:hypothetical protein
MNWELFYLYINTAIVCWWIGFAVGRFSKHPVEVTVHQKFHGPYSQNPAEQKEA